MLSLWWPSSRWALVEVSRRRALALETAVAELGLGGRVAVVCARAEEVGRDPAHRGTYDLVTARSFGPPAVTAECGAPLLRLGGRLVVAEPPADATRWPLDGLEALGLAPSRRLAGPPTVQVLIQQDPCPSRFPRRPGIPAKRPLF